MRDADRKGSSHQAASCATLANARANAGFDRRSTRAEPSRSRTSGCMEIKAFSDPQSAAKLHSRRGRGRAASCGPGRRGGGAHDHDLHPLRRPPRARRCNRCGASHGAAARARGSLVAPAVTAAGSRMPGPACGFMRRDGSGTRGQRGVAATSEPRLPAADPCNPQPRDGLVPPRRSADRPPRQCARCRQTPGAISG